MLTGMGWVVSTEHEEARFRTMADPSHLYEDTTRRSLGFGRGAGWSSSAPGSLWQPPSCWHSLSYFMVYELFVSRSPLGCLQCVSCVCKEKPPSGDPSRAHIPGYKRICISARLCLREKRQLSTDHIGCRQHVPGGPFRGGAS